jgi:hypothetical protein
MSGRHVSAQGTQKATRSSTRTVSEPEGSRSKPVVHRPLQRADTLRPATPPPQRADEGLRPDDSRRDTYRPTKQQAASNALAANR